MDALKGIPNPFRQTVVADPWQANTNDVFEIHADAFRLCDQRLSDVQRDGHTRSVLLFGDAGSGKTHLLRRLRARWLGEPPREADPIRREIVFVAVKLQTSPHYLWRYLRQSLVDDLLRSSPDGPSQLERILLRRLAEDRNVDGDLRLWFDWIRDQHNGPREHESAINEMMDVVNSKASLGRDLCVVLVHLLLNRHHRDAKAWLRGDPLPESVLDSLGLAPDPDDGIPEDQARQIVAALCRLAGPKVPVIFCFDQIEALQVDRSDNASLFAFGRMVMELFQATQNVLIITCVQIRFLATLRESVPKPAWDRLSMNSTSIVNLMWDAAVKLVVSRMDAVPRLKDLRRSEPTKPLWPLNFDRLGVALKHAQTARRILGVCAEQFDDLQGIRRVETTEPLPLDELWREAFTNARARYSVDRTPAIIDHGLPMLLKLTAPEWKRGTDTGIPDADPLLRGPDGRIGIHLSFAKDMRSVWHPLKRLNKTLQDGQLEKLLILRRADCPVSSPKAIEHLQGLLNAGARAISPTSEVIMALDALSQLLSAAKAGDLSTGGQTVEVETIQAWLKVNLPDDLRRFAEEVVKYPGVDGGGNPPVIDIAVRLAEILEERPILPLSEAAAELGSAEADLEAVARRRADAYGFVQGPPHVLFRMIPETEPRNASV